MVVLCFALGAEAATPKRVLILHSFGRGFAPYDSITSVFRADLARRATAPISFVEALNLAVPILVAELARHIPAGTEPNSRTPRA